MNNFKLEEIPPIIARSEKLQPVDATFKDLKDLGVTDRNSYGMSAHDTVEFPASEEECMIKKIPVNEDGRSYQGVVLVAKNGKPAWFSLSNLRRLDNTGKPVHPLAEYIFNELRNKALPKNDMERLKLVFGKTISAETAVTYNRARFGGEGFDPVPTAKLYIVGEQDDLK